MDAILENSKKKNISPRTPFPESIAKKLSVSIDDLFHWADKYAMLEDDIWVVSQQILVIIRSTQENKARNSKSLGSGSKQSYRKFTQHDQRSHCSWLLLLFYMSDFSYWFMIYSDPSDCALWEQTRWRETNNDITIIIRKTIILQRSVISSTF